MRRHPEQWTRLRAVLRLSPTTLRSFWPRQRIRRPFDAGRLLLTAGALVALVLLGVARPAALRVPASHAELTGVLRALVSAGNVVASWAVLAALVGIAIAALRTHRFSLTCALLAFPLGPLAGLGIALLAGRFGGAEVTGLLLGRPHEAAGLPVTAAVAFVVGAHPGRRRLRTAAGLSIAAGAGCAYLLGSLTVA